MLDWPHMADNETVRTYNRSAAKLAEYFSGIGARVSDIEKGLSLSGRGMGARVVEAGCGDGRDAAEILPRVAFYEGYDPSEGLLEIARARLPHASFVKADAHTYEHPSDIDVIFAFASFLHIPKEELPGAFVRAYAALRSGGILYLSLKERPSYEKQAKEDDHGKRMFYFYTPALILELAGDGFEHAHEDHQTIGTTDWFTLALRKR